VVLQASQPLTLLCCLFHMKFLSRDGPMKNGRMNGVGVLTNKVGEKQNVLMKDDMIICDKKGDKLS